MSDHYIYLVCSTPECASRDSIYTGDTYSSVFDDSGPDSFEGESISLICLACQAANLQLATYVQGTHLMDCSLHNAPAMAPRVCDCGYLPSAGTSEKRG
jgi:hypothetical protein